MKTLLYPCLIISILGIILLLFLAQNSIPEIINISEIYVGEIYDKIAIEAKIIEIKNYDNFKLLKLEDFDNNINAVIYSKNNLSININQTYLIIGKIQEYNKEKQIKIEKIIKK